MDRRILNFINEFTDKPFEVDRLLVSAFLIVNRLDVKHNEFLKKYIIKGNQKEKIVIDRFNILIKDKFNNRFTLEKLIELFEFVISPKEKIVTGAVYTPLRIREYIVSQTIPKAGISRAKIADIACGCAGFLLTAAKHIKKYTKKKYVQIINENLYGLDIAEYSVNRSKIILALLALSNGEDINLKFNLYVGNSLDYDWRQRNRQIRNNNGFDYIVGNPPYVCSRNIDDETNKLLGNWQVTRTGHPDLYIPFFEIAIHSLTPTGTLGYITVNTFFKSINGRALREYFSELMYYFKIIDFRNEQVFQKRNTYTCICLINKIRSQFIDYLQTDSTNLKKLKHAFFSKNTYVSLDNFNGWNLGDINIVSAVKKIESLKIKIFSKFTFCTGIATLKNRIYKFTYDKKDASYFYIIRKKKEFKIERAICRDIINSNKVTTERKLSSLKEYIIFPYFWDSNSNKYSLLEESDFMRLYPETYSYLLSNQVELKKRDKGKKKYQAWYAYGRNQSLDVRGIKLFFPHITNGPSFVLCDDSKLLFYNGEAIVSEDRFELEFLKKILESPIFWFYIQKTSKPYSSEYFSLGKNYMKQFSIPDMTIKEKRTFLRLNKMKALEFLLKKYGLTKKEIEL